MNDINKGGEYRQYVKNIYSNQSEKSAREGLMSFATENGFDYRDVEKALQVYKYDTEENAFGENYYTKVAIANMVDMISGKYAKGTTIKGGGVGSVKERVIDYYINNSDNEDLIILMGVSDTPNLKQVAEKWVNNRDTYYDKIFNAIDGIHNRTWGENKFVELGLEKFADGGGVGNPSKKEMLDYLNMYFDNYSELRTIAIEEDNILTRRMLNTLDNEELEMAYDDAKYEIKADTQFDDGGGIKAIFSKEGIEASNPFAFRKKLEFAKKHPELLMLEMGGKIESEINELYKKSKFINDDFNWKLKLMEMIQDRSIEAYNIYQSLTKEQKEEVLQEQFEVDNDMGSDGDGDIETSKESIEYLLNDAKNGTKYEEFSLGGKIDNGYFNNCFLKSIFGV